MSLVFGWILRFSPTSLTSSHGRRPGVWRSSVRQQARPMAEDVSPHRRSSRGTPEASCFGCCNGPHCALCRCPTRLCRRWNIPSSWLKKQRRPAFEIVLDYGWPFAKILTWMGRWGGCRSRAQAQAVRAAALAEAQHEAQQLASRMECLEAARQMIGPRGGLPNLKGDLVRLATLLHVSLYGDETVEKIKGKIRPTLALLKASTPQESVNTRAKMSPLNFLGRGCFCPAALRPLP